MPGVTEGWATVAGIGATLGLALGVLLLVRWLVWRAVSAVTDLAARADRPVRRANAYVRAHPLLAAAASRFPRLSAFLKARLDRRSFTGLPLTLLVCAAAYLAALFAGLIDEVYEAEGLARVDAAIDFGLSWLRFPASLGVFRWITELGSAAAMTAVGLVAAAFFLVERRLRLIPGLWAAVIGAHVTTWTGKYVIARGRPAFLEIASEASPSFPSAHATAALAVYGFIAYAVIRRLPAGRERFEVAYWTAALVGLIAFSRVFLRVHFASDVAAGLLVGAFWLFVGIAVAEWPRTLAPARREDRR